MKKNMLMRLLAIVTLLGGSLNAWSQEPTIVVDPFSISTGLEKEVAIRIENNIEVFGFQATVSLPEQLEFVMDGSAPYGVFSSRKGANPDLEAFQLKADGSLTILYANSHNGIQPGDGAFFTFKVKAKSDGWDTTDIQLSNLNLTRTSAGGNIKVPNFEVPVTFVSFVCELYGEPASFNMNPGKTKTISVYLNNNLPLLADEMRIKATNGLTIGNFQKGDRVEDGVMIHYNEETGKLILDDMHLHSQFLPLLSGNEGVMFTFDVTAPDNFDGNAEIVLSDAFLQAVSEATCEPDAFTFSVSSGVNAYNAALDIVNGLQQKLDAALAQIASEYPTAADKFPGTEIQNAIDEMRTAIQAVYDANENDYTEATANAPEIEKAIEQLVQDAKAEVERQQANQKAYEENLKEIEALQQKLNETIAEIEANYPAGDDKDAQAAVQAEIDQAKADAAAALDAVKDEGTYSPVSTDQISADIDKLLADAKQAQADADEAERLDNNKKAYDADMKTINDLLSQYHLTVAEIADNYGAYRDANAEATVLNGINAAINAIVAAYKAVATEGVYETPESVDFEAIKAAIEKLLTDAQARAGDAEAARKAANEAAYNADLKTLEALQASLDATKAELEKDYADFMSQDDVAAAQKAIDDAKAEAKTAYDAVAEEGIYQTPFDANAIQAQIDALLADAKAAKENARVAANEAAAQADRDELEAIKKHYYDVVAEIKDNYSEFENAAAEADVLKDITTAESDIEKALAAVKTEGVYESPLDSEKLMAEIDALLEAAKNAKAEAERQAANNAAAQADYDTLDDVQRHFDNVVLEIKAQYADFEDKEAEEAVQAEINAAKEAVAKALEAVKEEGTYESPINKEALMESIDKLLADAKEAARVAANAAAYKEDCDLIAKMQDKLDEAEKDLRVHYPSANIDEKVQAIQDMIDEYQKAADDEKAETEDEGYYERQVSDLDIQSIEAAIKAMIEAIQYSGVTQVYVDEDGNAPTAIFTLNGVRVQNPEPNQVYIVVYPTKTVKRLLK